MVEPHTQVLSFPLSSLSLVETHTHTHKFSPFRSPLYRFEIEHVFQLTTCITIPIHTQTDTVFTLAIVCVVDVLTVPSTTLFCLMHVRSNSNAWGRWDCRASELSYLSQVHTARTTIRCTASHSKYDTSVVASVRHTKTDGAGRIIYPGGATDSVAAGVVTGRDVDVRPSFVSVEFAPVAAVDCAESSTSVVIECNSTMKPAGTRMLPN